MPELPIEYSNDGENPSQDLNSPKNNTPGEVILSIPSDSSYVRVVRLAVMGIASRMAFSFEDIEDIKLAVSEACNNAILHARPSNYDSANSSSPKNSSTTASGSAPVVVRLVAYTDRLEINVEDHGVIASPELLRPATNPAALGDLPEGGMGLFLIETLMDKVEHETGKKTVISMTKYVSPADKLSHLTPHHSGTAPTSASASASASASDSTKEPSAS